MALPVHFTGQIPFMSPNQLASKLGTCESAVCVRIDSRIESAVKIRIRIESSNQIFSTPTNINY